MEKTSNSKKLEIKEETPQDVTNHKSWVWIVRAWETCPTNMPLMAWYEKFREELLEMYCAQAEELETA